MSFIQILSNELDDVWTIPLFGSGGPSNLLSISIYQQGRGNPDDVEIAPRFGHLVHINAERLKPEFLVEIFDGREPGIVDGQSDYLEVWACEFSLKPVEGRHLRDTRRAPGGPDVQKERFASKISEGQNAPITVYKS